MKVLIACLTFLYIASAMADEGVSGRDMLKKWGMAYCLGTYQTQGPENEAGTAREGYFQLGSHYEQAYKNVRAYFKRVVPQDTRVMKDLGKPNNLMRCLDAYEHGDYSTLIRDQDRWLY
jgi:hypothetical protein